MAWSHDGRMLAAGSWDQRVWLWSLAPDLPSGELEEHAGCVWSVAWHPRGGILAGGSGDWTVRIWELTA